MGALEEADIEEQIVRRLVQRDVRAIARAISLVEDDAPEARSLLSACFPRTGRALTIGITGPPGAGKSSLVDRLSRQFLAQTENVGVLAIDPSSAYTGGALLGDRIRMQEHHADPHFYLRSMATRGALGGLAHKTADAASILDAAGFDRILIETVGVGQDEMDIVRLADITIVVLVPGMGDDVQSIKAGIMEIADTFVINKSDRDGTDRLESEIRAMQSYAEEQMRTPPILRTVAISEDDAISGIPQLAAAIEELRAWLHEIHESKQRLLIRRTEQWQTRLTNMLHHELMRDAHQHGLGNEQIARYAAAVAAREQDPSTIVTKMVADLMQGRN